MARVQYGALITEMRGKVAGTIFQGGKTGPVIRNQPPPTNLGVFKRSLLYTPPTNPDLYYPTADRVVTLARAAQAWRALTAGEQLDWNNAAVNFPAYDKFNQPYTPSGYQVFMQLNQNLQQTNKAIITAPPMPVVNVLPNVTYNIPDGNSVLQFDFDVPLGTGLYCKVFCTAQQSKGSAYKKGTLKYLGFKGDIAATSIDITAEYVAKYGTLQPNSRFYVQFVPMDPSTGQEGEKVMYMVDISATPLTPTLAKYTSPVPMGATGVGVPVVNVQYITFLNGNDNLDFDVQGPDAAMFNIRYNNTMAFVSDFILQPDVYGNIINQYLEVEFNPSSVGAKSATIVINSGGYGPINIALTGTGI